MVHTAPSRLRAARMRTCLRLGALLTAVLSLAAIAGPASAHRSSSHRSARHAQRAAGHRAATQVRHARRRRAGAEHRFVLASRARAQSVRHRRRHAARRHARRHTARRHVVRGCHGAHARLGHARPATIRHAVVCLIDRERTHRGLPRLTGNARLNSSAQRWTNTMVSHHAFSHGSDFSARISAVGFDWQRVGENIAAGYTTPAGAVRAWMRSTGHCQNILNPLFREAGTGSARAGRGTWTLDFGLLMSQRATSGNFGPASGCPYSG